MALSILDSLQEIDPKVTFADSQSQFTEAEGIASSLNQPLPNIGTFKDSLNFPQVSLGNVTDTISEVPVSADELKVAVVGKIDKIKDINLESLQAAIPKTPSADTFKDFDVKSLNSTISSLSQDLTGGFSIGNVPPATQNIFGEFEEFINKASMLPARTLDALLKVFKKLLDKLSNPEDLLSKIGSNVLTEIFTEQINNIAEQLPNNAILRLEANIKRRRELVAEYNTILDELEPTNLDQEKITNLRHTIKRISQDIAGVDASSQTLLANLQKFNITAFQGAIESVSQASAVSDDLGLASLFNSIKEYINILNRKIAAITDKLKQFTQKIPELIETGINKVSDIANTFTKIVTDKIESGKELLNQLTTYLQDVINKIKNFIEETAKKSTDLVKPIKEQINRFSDISISKINEFSVTVNDTTAKLETAIGNLNTKIETQLNREELKKKIDQLLDKVTAILDSPQVNNALQQAESGIEKITSSLQEVSLQPAFATVVTKSGDLEKKLKAVDVSQLSTASKTALKIGTEVIKQVDIPGTINPELKAAFDDILQPLENIVTSIEGEFLKIDQKISNLKPGTLVEEFLGSYIDKLVNTLNNYKPSKLLQPVKDLYQELLEKLDVLNPKQLLDKLEELYNKLLNVIKSLSPKPITDFLNEQLKVVTEQLDNLPVEVLVNKVTEGLSQLDTLMASLGLGDVLKLEFWQNLEEILSFSVADKIKGLEEIRDRLVAKVNAVDAQQLTEQWTTFQNAIATYVDNRKEAINITIIETATTDYTANLATLEIKYAGKKAELEKFQPDTQILVDYRDVRSRLEQLYTNFTATEPTPLQPPDILSQLTTIVADTKRLQGTQTQRNKLLQTANAKTPAQLLADFKQVIPNELNQQIINPIKEILTAIDNLLAQPRSVLDAIKNAIKSVQEAPSRLLKIISDLARTMGNKIRDAITSVKQKINLLGSEVVQALEQTYQVIVKTLESLSPRRILNSFDASDFTTINNLIQKLREPKDKVSEYISSKLSSNTKLLLASDSSGRNAAVITALNELLLDQQFYSAGRFEGVTLTKNAQLLIQKRETLESGDMLYLNRLLLEATYPGEIVMNLEAIFPYFQEKLADIYPDTVVKNLDILHQKIVQLITDIPHALGDSLNEQYDKKVLQKTQKLRDSIDNIFKALRARLYGLKSELDIGLDDVGDAFDRLINALPV
jgi:phage-related protein